MLKDILLFWVCCGSVAFMIFQFDPYIRKVLVLHHGEHFDKPKHKINSAIRCYISGPFSLIMGVLVMIAARKVLKRIK